MLYENHYYNFIYLLHDKDTRRTSFKIPTINQYTMTYIQTLHHLRSVNGFHPRINQIVGSLAPT